MTVALTFTLSRFRLVTSRRPFAESFTRTVLALRARVTRKRLWPSVSLRPFRTDTVPESLIGHLTRILATPPLVTRAERRGSCRSSTP